MATITTKRPRVVEYPTSDGKPMAETDFHRILMMALIQSLDYWYADKLRVYVSGNLLMYYVPGNKRKHVSPDVFVVKGVKKKKRLYYLTWEEGKNPSVVFEITSASTRKEDTDKKFILYRDVLKVPEYFLFDPFGDYLKPQLKGYRLQDGEYVPIALMAGRMPSAILGLHLEPTGGNLRLYDPATGEYVLTPEERAELEKERADEAKQHADEAKQHAAQEKKRADESERENMALAEEIARLRKENERLLQPKNEKKNGV